LASYEDYSEGKTAVIYGAENIVNKTLQELSRCKTQVDNCIDSNAPSLFAKPNHPVAMAFRELKKRGIRLRLIAEITKDNISDCKELMNVFELRHLDEVKGNFGIADSSYYAASAKSIGSSLPPLPIPPLLIESTLRPFVEQQQYFFDMLWRKAIPAKQRIKEIEEGLKREFIETLQDPEEIQNLSPKLITSATEEVDIIFSTPNTFKRYEREGMIELLARKADDGIKVRILLKLNNDIQPTVERLVNMHPQITIKNLDKSVQTKVITILADNELSLVIELKDDAKQNNNEAIGLATYSNSESTVLSYVSIFETLWLSPGNILISR
jgi:two-component system, OmpR family, sensor histidine kinase VicK